MGDPPCKGETELAGKVLEFQADMDHDGLPELFIASPCTYGNAGADFFVFRKNGNHYRYLGSLFLHPKAFKVLSMDADHLPKVILYRRHGCCQGSLVTVKHTGSGFTVVEEETIFPQDRDRERYRQIFSE